jgi:hypothetical protein
MEGRQRSCFRWRRLQPACTGGLMAGSLRIPMTTAMNHSWFSSLMTHILYHWTSIGHHAQLCSSLFELSLGLYCSLGLSSQWPPCFQRKVYRVSPIETYWCMVKPSKKLSLLLCVCFAFAGELPVRSHRQVVWRGQSSRWLNSTGVIRFTVQNLVTCSQRGVTCSQRGVTRQFSVVCTEDSLCNVFYCDRSLFVLINVYWRRYDVWNVLKTMMRFQPINCNF